MHTIDLDASPFSQWLEVDTEPSGIPGAPGRRFVKGVRAREALNSLQCPRAGIAQAPQSHPPGGGGVLGGVYTSAFAAAGPCSPLRGDNWAWSSRLERRPTTGRGSRKLSLDFGRWTLAL